MILYVILFLVVAVNGRPERQKTVEVVKDTADLHGEFRETTDSIAQRIIRNVNESLAKIVDETSGKKGPKSAYITNSRGKNGKAVQLVRNLPLGYKILIDLDVRLKEPEIAERTGFVMNKNESVGERQYLVTVAGSGEESNTTTKGNIQTMASQETVEEKQNDEYQIYVKKSTNETIKGGADGDAQNEDLSQMVVLPTEGATKTKEAQTKGGVSLRRSDLDDILDIFDDTSYGGVKDESNEHDLLDDIDIDRSLSPDKICPIITGLYKLIKAEQRGCELTTNTGHYLENPHETVLDWLKKHLDLF